MEGTLILILVVAEKPSVAMSYAKVLGATSRQDGYLEGNGYLVSWCVGHLVELAPPNVYDAKYTKWSIADLPILPQKWQYLVSASTKKQFSILQKLMHRPDVDSIVNSCDSGREGELIFRLVYEQAGCKKPVSRLWLSSMEENAIREGFAHLKPSTEYDALYNAALCRERADWMVGIRPIDIENFLKGMRRDGRSDSYISKARGMLYQIFQKAEANDLVRRNPVRLAEKMRATGTAKRKEAFTTAEVAHLMKVLPDDRMGLSIRLLLGTGMRMQELLALEPQFIEEDGSVIHIRQAVKVVKGTVSIGSPKSKDSIRDIPVPLNVRPCAIKLRDTTDQFIWESPKTGLPCNPTHFRDVFRKSLEEAGDVRLLTPHSCRHTYVSQMQALGVDIQTIQSIVGHADTEMTEHYLHVQESIRQSAIQLFNEAFSA